MGSATQQLASCDSHERGNSASEELVGKLVRFQLEPHDRVMIGTLLQYCTQTTFEYAGPRSALIMVEAPKPYLVETYADSILGLMIPSVPIPELKLAAKEVSKPAPKE